MKRPFAYLDINSWTYIGSIGAEHFYGKLDFIHPNREKVELKQKMSAKMAKYLNKKDGCESFCRYRPGELTDRFDTLEEVKRFGISVFSKEFPNGILLTGDACSISPWSEVIYAPDDLIELKDAANSIHEVFSKLNGYEGKNEKVAEELDDLWCKLILPFRN